MKQVLNMYTILLPVQGQKNWNSITSWGGGEERTEPTTVCRPHLYKLFLTSASKEHILKDNWIRVHLFGIWQKKMLSVNK